MPGWTRIWGGGRPADAIEFGSVGGFVDSSLRPKPFCLGGVQWGGGARSTAVGGPVIGLAG